MVGSLHCPGTLLELGLYPSIKAGSEKQQMHIGGEAATVLYALNSLAAYSRFNGASRENEFLPFYRQADHIAGAVPFMRSEKPSK
jgi:hypothetical protein